MNDDARPMGPLLELTPREAADVLFELTLTDPAARARALAIAAARTGALPPVPERGGRFRFSSDSLRPSGRAREHDASPREKERP